MATGPVARSNGAGVTQVPPPRLRKRPRTGESGGGGVGRGLPLQARSPSGSAGPSPCPAIVPAAPPRPGKSGWDNLGGSGAPARCNKRPAGKDLLIGPKLRKYLHPGLHSGKTSTVPAAQEKSAGSAGILTGKEPLELAPLPSCWRKQLPVR